MYYHGAEGVLNESRPVYGNYSGMGWPMHYRYPPIFLFFAMPFTLLPLPWASALWTFLKSAALFLLIRALWNRLGPTTKQGRMAHSLLLAGPYVVEDLRYGNAQGFIFALTAAALLLLPRARTARRRRVGPRHQHQGLAAVLSALSRRAPRVESRGLDISPNHDLFCCFRLCIGASAATLISCHAGHSRRFQPRPAKRRSGFKANPCAAC